MTIPSTQQQDGRRRTAADAAIAAGAVAATAILFYIDSTQPRGVIDGVGYPAVVALSSWFGRRVLLAAAALCSALIVAAHFLLPDAGISVVGELGNRAFGLASIWIIADLLRRRIAIEAQRTERGAILRRNQAALARIVRDALVSERSFIERIRLVNEIACETLDTDLTGTFRFFERGLLMRCIDAFQKGTAKHFALMDIRTEDTPGYDRLAREDYTLVIDDMDKTAAFGARQLMMNALDIKASLAVGILSGSDLAGQLIFARLGKPYTWTEPDIAFARAVGNLLTTLFAAERNAETLAALDLVGEGIFTENEAGVAIYANSAAIEIALSGKTDSATLPLAAIAFPRPPAPLTAAVDRTLVAFAGRELEIQRTRLPDGGIISRINDVTAHNAVQRERDQLQARLQTAAKMEAIGQLAGGVAHDFNNILGAIMGFAGFLDQDLPANSEQHHFAARILSASQRGKELVDQILTFARGRGEGGDSADLGRALRQAADLLRGSFPSAIALDIATDAQGLFVACGASRLSQLLLNLCINARDAIGEKPGKIALRVAVAPGSEPAALAAADALGEISVGEADTSRSYARIEVSDTGGGIAPEILKHIFEPFYTTKDRHRGTGLGLAVVYGVIESCGGFAHVRVAPGQGTIFSVYLPLAAGAELPSDENAAAQDQPRGSERVLVVDDEPDIVDMMVIGLERLGYHAVGVSDPHEALEALTEDPSAFDIVVTDLVMPTLHGSELIRQIKAIRPDIRAILCTAFSDGANLGESTQADAHFRKPVAAVAIANCIRSLREQTG
ncbi:MAG TPA: ATP-binding protein [Rhizomicrobium sp.]|nr:ATP-binding protein [Rhizomicrobium sp.]